MIVVEPGQEFGGELTLTDVAFDENGRMCMLLSALSVAISPVPGGVFLTNDDNRPITDPDGNPFSIGQFTEIQVLPGKLLAECEEELAMCFEALTLATLDSDLDNACPDTAPGDSIDAEGCSQAQFCRAIDVRHWWGHFACNRADWRNDEPLGHPRDCRAVWRWCVPRHP